MAQPHATHWTCSRTSGGRKSDTERASLTSWPSAKFPLRSTSSTGPTISANERKFQANERKFDGAPCAYGGGHLRSATANVIGRLRLRCSTQTHQRVRAASMPYLYAAWPFGHLSVFMSYTSFRVWHGPSSEDSESESDLVASFECPFCKPHKRKVQRPRTVS